MRCLFCARIVAGPTPEALYGGYDPDVLYPAGDGLTRQEAADRVAGLRNLHPDKTTVVTMELCLGSASKCVSEIDATLLMFDDVCWPVANLISPG